MHNAYVKQVPLCAIFNIDANLFIRGETMFMNTSKRLYQLYGEVKLYVTELQFNQTNQPVKAYVFLTEYNTEVELFIEGVEAVKPLRSREETLMLIRALD